MALVRVREPGAGVLFDPETGGFVAPLAGDYYDADSALVRAHPWAFASDEELLAERSEGIVESVLIERATRAPGERSGARKR